MDSAIHWINLYPGNSAIGFPNTYPLDSDYPVDSAIQRFNNRGFEAKNVRISEGVWGGLSSLTAVTFSSSAGSIPCLRKQ